MTVLAVFIDASDASHRGFEDALNYKKENDVLYIVHAVETIQFNSAAAGGMGVVGGGAVFFNSSHFKEANESLIKRGKEIAAEYLKICKEREVTNVKTLVLTTDDTKEGACEFLKEKSVDTAFVGSRGLGAVKRFVLGSFSTYIVNHAQCNVFVSRPNKSHEHEHKN